MEDHYVSLLERGDLQELSERIRTVTAERREIRPRKVRKKELLESGFGANKTLYGIVLRKRSMSDSSDKIIGYAFYIYLFSTWTGHFICVDDMMIFPGTDKKLEMLLIEEILKLVKREGLLRLDFQVPKDDLTTSRIVAVGAKPLPHWYTVRFSTSAMISLTRERNEQVHSKYHIRKATDEDMQSVLYLIQCLAEYEDEPDALQIGVKDLVQGLGKYFQCFVAEVMFAALPHAISNPDLKSNKMPHNPSIAGMAIYLPIFCKHVGRILHLEDLYVVPKYRKQGLGTELMKQTAEVALLSGCSEMDLQVLDWNTKAADLYMRLGGELLTDYVITRIEQNNYNTLELDMFS